MSKTAKIREALNAGPLSIEQLTGIVGGTEKQAAALVQYLKKQGEVKVADGKVQLTGRREAAPPQGRSSRQSKKPAGKRSKKTGRKAAKLTLRKIAERIKRTPPAEQFRDILLDNLIGAGALLRQAVEDGIEDFEGNYALRNAVANQQRAEQILAASRSA